LAVVLSAEFSTGGGRRRAILDQDIDIYPKMPLFSSNSNGPGEPGFHRKFPN
jgi:hypothetical protein